MSMTFEVLDNSVMPFLNELVQRRQIRWQETITPESQSSDCDSANESPSTLP